MNRHHQPTIGHLIRDWRQLRRLSQLDLAPRRRFRRSISPSSKAVARNQPRHGPAAGRASRRARCASATRCFSRAAMRRSISSAHWRIPVCRPRNRRSTSSCGGTNPTPRWPWTGTGRCSPPTLLSRRCSPRCRSRPAASARERAQAVAPPEGAGVRDRQSGGMALASHRAPAPAGQGNGPTRSWRNCWPSSLPTLRPTCRAGRDMGPRPRRSPPS